MEFEWIEKTMQHINQCRANNLTDIKNAGILHTSLQNYNTNNLSAETVHVTSDHPNTL
jgi:hypothetical protein